jgi:DNA-binding CsgD family transcriptional regulator
MSRAKLHELQHDGEPCVLIEYETGNPAVLASLTASEREVALRWAEGASMRVIATARDVSVRTIAKQVASIYEKLEVSSRAQLVAALHAPGAPGPERERA